MKAAVLPAPSKDLEVDVEVSLGEAEMTFSVVDCAYTRGLTDIPLVLAHIPSEGNAMVGISWLRICFAILYDFPVISSHASSGRLATGRRRRKRACGDGVLAFS